MYFIHLLLVLVGELTLQNQLVQMHAVFDCGVILHRMTRHMRVLQILILHRQLYVIAIDRCLDDQRLLPGRWVMRAHLLTLFTVGAVLGRLGDNGCRMMCHELEELRCHVLFVELHVLLEEQFLKILDVLGPLGLHGGGVHTLVLCVVHS